MPSGAVCANRRFGVPRSAVASPKRVSTYQETLRARERHCEGFAVRYLGTSHIDHVASAQTAVNPKSLLDNRMAAESSIAGDPAHSQVQDHEWVA